jgi:uncharacterized membrane protein SpoIIM required for sporulation
MIPFVAVVSVPDRRSHTFRLSIPLFLVWLLVLPLSLLLLPAVFIGGLVCQVNPLRALSVVWQILSALKDTNVEVARRSASVSICIL